MTSAGGESGAERTIAGPRVYLILAALVAGVAAGAVAARLGEAVRAPTVAWASGIGGLWLNGLKMTIIPLILALLISGVARGADAAKSGRIAARSIGWFVAVYIFSAIVGLLVTPLLLSLLPLPAAAANALRAGLGAISSGSKVPVPPSIGDFFGSVIPSNAIASAANGDILQIVIFGLLFALAMAQISRAKSKVLVGFFDAVSDALLVIIGWVLSLAPFGVFALAVAVGASAGGAALVGVVHYLVIVCAAGLPLIAAGYVLAFVGGRLPPGQFARTMLPSQALAISTQSSLACLPPMLLAARMLGLRDKVVDVTLPLAVALFRATGPGMNIAVPIYLAHLLGLHIGAAAIVAGLAVAVVLEFGSVSLPGQLTYFTSIAPIAVAMGVPVAPLLLFVAVDMIPDIIRTVGNVTMDVAVAAVADRDQRPAIARTRSE